MADLESIPPPRPTWPVRRDDRTGQDHERKRLPPRQRPGNRSDEDEQGGRSRHIDDYA